MTDRPIDPRRSHPDPAALDELLRAFASTEEQEAEAPADLASAAGAAADAPVDESATVAAPTQAPPDEPSVEPPDEPSDEPRAPAEPAGPIATDADATADDEADATAADEADATADDEAVDALLAEPIAEESPAPAPPADRKTITIDDDDDQLPDPVYVKGELEAQASEAAAVVFIDDDATDDALVPDASGVLGRGIEPRLRDRRIAVRRAEARGRLKWVVLAGGVVAVLIAGLAVLGSPLFAVDHVDVTGAVYTDPERLAAVVDDIRGTPVLIVDTDAAERELEAIPWVDEARVRTDFPNRAMIEIRERAPLATYQGPDGRFRVIDREGRVLDVIDGQPIAYMLITGPDALDLEPGQYAPAGYAAAAELVQALTGSVRGRVTSIEVNADGSSMRMFLDDGSPDGMEVRFGAATDLLAKLVRLETVIADAIATGANVVDVSTAEVTVQ